MVSGDVWAPTQIAGAINLDGDGDRGFGSSPRRTGALLVSNIETSAIRRTGLQIRADTDGDPVKPPRVSDNPSANQFDTADFAFRA